MPAPASLVGTEQLEIRSFRVVFSIERRLHRIDRWRLPLPYGIPVRGIGYAAATLLAVLVLGAVPGIGSVVTVMPAPLKFVLVPVGVAALLARVKVDGRPAHRFALAWARRRLGPRVVDAFQPVPAAGSVQHLVGEIVLADAPAAADYRPATVCGPATVTLLHPARACVNGNRLEVHPQTGPPLRRGKQITLQPGQTLRVREAGR